jgi:HSP20 family protein
MANLIRRENNQQVSRNNRGQDYGFEPLRSWNPFRMMDAMLSWDPFRDMAGPWLRQGEVFLPRFDVKETKDGYFFHADLPGVKESDLDISVTGNTLTVSGKREDEHQEEGDQYHTTERSYGQFTRSFSLPEGTDLDNVKADLKDGVLTIHLGKKAEVQPRRISVSGSNSAKA